MISDGVPMPSVLGPADVVDIELFLRDRTAAYGNTAYTWASEFIKNVVSEPVLPMRLDTG